MSTVEVDHLPGERVEVLMSNGTWGAGVVHLVGVFRSGRITYHVEAGPGEVDYYEAEELRPALAAGDVVRWSTVPGEFEVVLVEGDQAVIRTTYATRAQQLFVANRSDLRQAPPAPVEAVQPQPEEMP